MSAVDSFDISILEYVMNNIRKEWLDPIVIFITHLGKAGIAWILLILVLLLFKKTRRVGLACGVALVLNVILCNGIIKPLVARPRPYDLYQHIVCIVKPQWDYSFPSGHTAASFSVSSVLPYMKMKKRYSIPALVLALLIALSRIYVCVHYPTDVICGAVLGGMAGFAGFMLYTRVIEKKAPKKLMKFIFNFPGIETKEK
ncbi:MAG: phosphatase PAP2 family protein [Lachnospiraceae bacterium]|nr:phosphatase PAP2 family protein [Lachnospiraceae bacterium]